MYRISSASPTFCLLFLMCASALPHDVPDGVVERDAQAILLPDRLEIHYTLELNERSMRRELKRLRPDSDIQGDALALWKQYRQALIADLARKIEVRIDGHLIALKAVRSETIEKHSIQLLFILRALLEVARQEQSLLIVDKNFADKPGYHRLALKGRGDVVLHDCSVPPIVSRIPRTPWEKLDANQKRQTTRAQATFTLVETLEQ